MTFPNDFIWGAATSSYQIEGGGLSEGRGESIWDRFCRTPGKVFNGDTGDVACDHLHLYKEDVALMKYLGLHAYRFSVAWGRVLPQGIGATNPAGLAFYDKLVDELLDKGITPYLTLYHWDLPQALQDKGGWENRDSLQWFAEYADLMTRQLGDRVKQWTTLNEPWVIAFLGNLFGIHAPGIQDAKTAYKVAHHIMLAHGKTVPLIRRNVPDASVGITIDFTYFGAASDKPEDKAAAKREWDAKNTWFADAAFKGSYPANIVECLGDVLDGIDLSEASQIAVPVDFLGVNYYTRTPTAHGDGGLFNSRSVRTEGAHHTDIGWEVYPKGLEEFLVWLHTNYAPKAIYITENGAAYDDPTPTDTTEVVEDPKRAAYYQAHFKACADAIAQGVPLRGYFAWSLLDNFEWAYGYAMRFGIVYVDFATQRRIPKRSALLLRDIIRQTT
jgi:beta-glucosidase